MTRMKVEHYGVHCREGGNVHIVDAISPHHLRLNSYGVGIGPLQIRPYANTTVIIDEFRYSTAEPWSLPLLSTQSNVGTLAALGILAGGSPDDDEDDAIDPEEYDVTRRELLIAVGATATMAAGTARAEQEKLNVAEFTIEDNPRGFQLQVDDVAQDILPADHSYYVEVDGTSRGDFNPGNGDRITISPGITGEAKVQSDDVLAFWEKIVAATRSDDKIEYTLRHDKPFSNEPTDDEVILSDQPVVVDPIREAGESGVLVKIDGDRVPHIDDGSAAIGNWYLRDDTALVYRVGEAAPDVELTQVHINVGRLDKFLDRF